MPRFSRISWKSRDDAEPPSSASSSDAVKRRRSERAMPGAPMQTWYCSVSLRWKRTLGRRRPHERAADARALAGAFACFRCAFWSSATSSSCFEVPRRGDDDVAGLVHRLVVARERAPADGRDHLGGPDHRPAERVVAEDRLARSGRARALRRVLVHRDLLEHDLALRVEVGEDRRVDHVASSRRAPARGGGRRRGRRRRCARARSPRSARRRARRRSRRSPAPSRSACP